MISTEIRPRILIEFEDLVGRQIPEKKRLFSMGKKTPQYAFTYAVLKVMWHMTWNLHQEIEVITLHGEDYAEQLAERLETVNSPARQVWAYQPEELASRLLTMPYVAAVYTPSVRHALLYGSRGRLVTEENVLKMGQF